MKAIRIADLRRSYRSTTGLLGRKRTREALRGVNLAVEDGELFGLLGPNGAGKTSLIKVLATVLLPTSGAVEVLGFDVVKDVQRVRENIGLVFGGDRGLYGSISARDTLLFWAAMYKLPAHEARLRTEQALEQVGLTARAEERVQTFSRGMKQRLHLARGLISRPRVLLLDEPTIGLDPVASRAIRSLVQELNKNGTTVFLTTHYMAEAEALCDRVAFINEGAIVLLDRPAALRKLAADAISVEADVPIAAIDGLAAATGGTASPTEITTDAEGYRRVRITGAPLDYGRTLEVLARLGALRVATPEPNLEDIYLRLLGDRGMKA